MTDATNTEEGAAPAPDPSWPDDSGRCESCTRTKDRVITRINRTGRPKLCDQCNEEMKR